MSYFKDPKKTSWLRVKFVGDPPWELRPIDFEDESIKNFAAFATRNFRQGELICVENPTVWVHGHHPYNDNQVKEIDEQIAMLSLDDRKSFFDLTNVFPMAPSESAGIFMTNSFDMTDSPNGESSGMYCAIARLNHSCYPNAQQTHIPETKEEVLYASRDIKEGEEIADCYIDLRQSAEERRKVLKELYRFDCNCAACTLPADALKAEDSSRKRAALLESQILATAEDDPQLALELALQSVFLLTRPEAIPWSSRYIAEAHLTVFHIAEALDDSILAYQHLKKAHEWNIKLQGLLTPDSKRSAALLLEHSSCNS